MGGCLLYGFRRNMPVIDRSFFLCTGLARLLVDFNVFGSGNGQKAEEATFCRTFLGRKNR